MTRILLISIQIQQTSSCWKDNDLSESCLKLQRFIFRACPTFIFWTWGAAKELYTKYICDKSPDNNFCLLDASEEMLNKARGNLTSSKSNISFSHRTFEDYSTSQSEDWKYDFVFSANAIHHLDFTQKTALYTKIYKELKPGGLFLNIDAVHPSSAHSEEIQFQLWRNWMNETLERNGKEKRNWKIRQHPVPIQEQS